MGREMIGFLKGLNGSTGSWIVRAVFGLFLGWASLAGQGLVSKVVTSIESYGARLQGIESKTDAVRDRVDSMDADSKFRFGLTTEHLNKIDGKVDKLDDRLRNVETGSGRR